MNIKAAVELDNNLRKRAKPPHEGISDVDALGFAVRLELITEANGAHPTLDNVKATAARIIWLGYAILDTAGVDPDDALRAAESAMTRLRPPCATCDAQGQIWRKDALSVPANERQPDKDYRLVLCPDCRGTRQSAPDPDGPDIHNVPIP